MEESTFLVGFYCMHPGRLVVAASSPREAKIAVFKKFQVNYSNIRAQEREDAWDHVRSGYPPTRDGGDPPLFLRTNPAPCDL